MIHFVPRVVALVTFLALVAGAFAQDQESERTIADVLRSTPEVSTLLRLLEDTNLLSSLERSTRVTFFAPSDRAFERYGEEAVAALLRDRGSLDVVLRHHLLYGAAEPSALRRLDAVTTLEGTRLDVRDLGPRVRVGGVRLPEEGIRADNGIVYVIDELMLPRASRLIKDMLAYPDAR